MGRPVSLAVRIAACGILLAPLGGSPAARAEDPPPVAGQGDRDAKVELARSLARDLAGRGYPVDVGRLTIEVRPQEEMEKDIERQGGILLSPTYFEGMAVFSRALAPGPVGSATAGLDGRALRRRAAKMLAGALVAYYQPGENRLVFKKPKEGDALAALTDGKRVVAHELVHAFQDQSRGFEKLFGSLRATAEGSRTMSCLVEGEAEAVSISLETDLATAEDEDLAPEMERLIGGEINTLVYSAGRTFMVGLFREGGWKAVAGAFGSPPPSTEQILHPQKRGKDVPATVDLPPLPLPVVHVDVLGELEIRRWLLLIGLGFSDARVAAAGWDGDRLRVHRDPGGGEVVLWRSVWDRPLDAEQFARALQEHAGGSVVRSGRLVDWSFGSTAALADQGRRALAGSAVSPPVVPEDAASAEAVEAAWAAPRAGDSKRDGESWLHAATGVRVPIPKGWEPTEVQGAEILADLESAAKYGFAPNINCQSGPLPLGKDLDGLMEDNRAQFAAMRGLTLDFMEKTTVGGVAALRYGFHGAMSPGAAALRFLGVIVIRGNRQIVVTATTMEKLWDEQRAMLAECMAGIRFEGPVKAGRK